MLQIQVKKIFIDSQTREIYGTKYLNPGSIDLIMGHLCRTDFRQITKVEKDAVQSYITENCVLHNPNGRKGTQWTFIQPASSARLAQEIKGITHIEITPPISSQK